MQWKSATVHRALWAGTALLAGCANLPLALVPEGTPHFALEEVNGRVLVTRDTAYFVASPDTGLEVGDRVVSMDNAEALLLFTQTDEQGELLGEPCQLRLPASAQITLQSYRDCFDENAIVLNNVVAEPAAEANGDTTQTAVSVDSETGQETPDQPGVF
ncbi:MAG: hypothetical protein KDK04_08645 [Candidatus Competibacteraceae bacterium]|nr:hypothetical protein [Candidatus Competibacteraceae bacterium]MCB1809222.1 hypothetical protein [Candidatus Competibacteraceae bacterium]MCB1811768.1 hypothetical protein [Candidatus Competibacteraceae bacterium]